MIMAMIYNFILWIAVTVLLLAIEATYLEYSHIFFAGAILSITFCMNLCSQQGTGTDTYSLQPTV